MSHSYYYDMNTHEFIQDIESYKKQLTIIGLSGYGRSGKDTVASFLVERGFTRLAFADILREALYVLNPYLPTSGGKFVRLADYVDEFGWEVAKKNDQVRLYIQRIGSDVGRDLIHKDIWVDSLFDRMSLDTKYVISDVRFFNEANRVRRHGGQMWRINRPGCGPVNGHYSEIVLDEYNFDHVIDNSGSEKDLEDKVLDLIGTLV